MRVHGLVALLAEGVDRNLKKFKGRVSAPRSPSSRRAWIEIFYDGILINGRYVALLAEGVDRNNSLLSCRPWGQRVALLAEGVDRNKRRHFLTSLLAVVALLAEGVDRNLCLLHGLLHRLRRPPRGGRG